MPRTSLHTTGGANVSDHDFGGGGYQVLTAYIPGHTSTGYTNQWKWNYVHVYIWNNGWNYLKGRGPSDGDNGSLDTSTLSSGQQVFLECWNYEWWRYYVEPINYSPISYTVTYNGNGADGGGTGNNTATYASGFALNANGFGRTGYYFSYWQLHVNDGTQIGNYNPGTGPTWNYAQGGYAYAIWTAHTYTVTYNANTSTGGDVPGNTAASYPTAVPTAGANTLVKTGYTLSGWATSAAGAQVYNLSSSFTHPGTTATLTLYAKWTINTYKITYNGNGKGVTNFKNVNYNVATAHATVNAVGYTLLSWNTLANGSGTSYLLTNNYTIPATDSTLYAIWRDDTPTTGISFSNIKNVFGVKGTADISISEYLASISKGANTLTSLSEFKGKGIGSI